MLLKFRKWININLRNFSTWAHLKKSFLRNVSLIVNKLQRQKYDSGLFQVDSVYLILSAKLLFIFDICKSRENT